MRARALALIGLLAACGQPDPRAAAQDLGALALAPRVTAAVPQVARVPSRSFAADDPARILVIGDSLGQGFGQFLDRQAAARGLAARVLNRARVSTGLARADYYDWPAGFAAAAAEVVPDIVVAHFGANDMQTVIRDDGRSPFGTPEWEAAYRTQIRAILATAAASGAMLWWIGPAPDGNSGLNRHLARINPIFADEAAGAGAVYFPLAGFTAGEGGAFARAIEIEGRLVTIRTGDGSHFNATGYTLVADRLIDDMLARVPSLLPGPPAEGPARVLMLSLQ
ncbi:MAG: DUF459 domain-containing protein [Rhodobacteraceae bacterium]|jgi:hypothetical protein|nr:DUF459 domain-containing protein [Paracoccaceae bacterium]